MIEIKVVRNVILNNIDVHDQPSRIHCSTPEVAKIFQIRIIQIFDQSDTDISDLIIKYFYRDES